MNDEFYPSTARILAERQELIRLCAARVVADHESGRGSDPERLQWARGELAKGKSLEGPLSDGAARARAFPTYKETHGST